MSTDDRAHPNVPVVGESRREPPEPVEPMFVPARLVLDDAGFDELVERMERPPAPTDALIALMRR